MAPATACSPLRAARCRSRLFGPHGYGERTGLLGAPARAAQAFAPLLFGLLLEAIGVWALLVSAGLCLAALGALLCLHAKPVE